MISHEQIQALSKLRLPAQMDIEYRAAGLDVFCLKETSKTIEVDLTPYRSRGPQCKRCLAVDSSGRKVVIELDGPALEYDAEIDIILRSTNSTIEGETLDASLGSFKNPGTFEAALTRYKHVLEEWTRGIRYTTEQLDEAGTPLRNGLRVAQSGALHAIASHRTVSKDPALIVMPTGTGKTEVMIAASIAAASARVLIVVPTDPLRTQTANRFLDYSVLVQAGVIDQISNPVIGILKKAPAEAQFEAIKTCNVVVTTMSAISQASLDLQSRFAELFTDLFIDEAHHREASSWRRFHEVCGNLRSVLFTATPYREDGRPVGAKIIYNYPLAEAQKSGYFSFIHFEEVFEPDSELSDAAIADTAVCCLRRDLEQGLNHILLARAKSIDASEKLYQELYLPNYKDLNPILVHSRTKNRNEILQAIKDGQHKIVVCVDMFGEGYDLPNLKIAALHATHKSLAVTLQFIGRFARSGSSDVGRATFVANTAEDNVADALEGLYFEDADWNQLLPDLSYDAIDPQEQLSEIVSRLSTLPGEDQEAIISAIALKPKISTQVFRTDSFRPQAYKKGFKKNQKIFQPMISAEDRLLVLVVNQPERPEWTDSKSVQIDRWDLFIAYHNEAQGLLFVHSSNKGKGAAKFAKAISQEPVQLRGEDTFKAFSGLRRVSLHNVGLFGRSRNLRYQMFAGLDVRQYLDPATQQDKTKSNITGLGFEDGNRTSIGCSSKGKIWSLASGSLAKWRTWCDHVGHKLTDPNAHPDDFLKHTLVPEQLDTLPTSEPLVVDWPEQLYESFNFQFEVLVNGKQFGFHECELDLTESTQSHLLFSVCTSTEEISTFEFKIIAGSSESRHIVTHISGPEVAVKFREVIEATEFFTNNPPTILYSNGSVLSGNLLLSPREELQETFDRELIQVLDWTDVDLTVESRWRNGDYRNNSIQQYFLDYLSTQTEALFLFDDDDTGESADIISIEETETEITVYLWHCKYSSASRPGRRVSDIDVVCGQAEKSVKWTYKFDRLVAHLISRDTHSRNGRDTRFVRGTAHELNVLKKRSKKKFIDYQIGIVQPGVKKSAIPNEHLALLGAANSYVRTVVGKPLLVISSA